MRAVVILILGLALITSVAGAEEKVFAGDNYLKLSKKHRVTMVSKMLNAAGDAGIAIEKSPKFYCQLLDMAYDKSPVLQKQSFANTFKTLIIMEYDWDQKGVDKDTLARKWLGDDLYKTNKIRLQKK